MKSNAILGATALVTAAVLWTSSSVIAESTSSMENVEYRWEVNMRGKPPYKRERVPVHTIDVAAMEVIDENVATEIVWQTDFTGRPPFSRKQVELPVVDAASMELVEEEPKTTTFRGRPPFNRHR